MGGLPAYRPMLAQLGAAPARDEGWAYEMKWDGVRALAYVEDGRVRLYSRNAKEITAAYPELAGLADAVGDRRCVLDGEVVAFDAQGRPRFEALQPRMHQRDPARVRRLMDLVPVSYLLFDVLHVGDRPVIGLPYLDRRALLAGLVRPGPHWDVPPHLEGVAAAQVVDESRRLGLEGIVAKRVASPYRPGRRSPEWRKVKNFRSQEVVVGGWQPGQGRRADTIGSLLVGVYEEGRLRYAGHVGTGFSEAALRELDRLLRPLERAASPFDDEVPREFARSAHWVEPRLVGEVRYAEWTGDHRLRHPSWRGLRDDKTPGQVRREDA
ncbi:ATP-dependent DNA ligase [Thermopolyspora flexuosa]|jgi:bifunctional non-homologous end joining protein LigD|uniref:DNA ligase (ATP) n=1 Tax=Thermopolyspora flexuosa TaxID=103836 RepID=A0A543J2S1_9ACTN|nr:non-homologous end-joining DNA ligase [Thermopolyspora flexuosa]TQM77126.1 bifunctional non-homologous end joining protein LigD [Thermopolyspora flexuosa]GGM75918.1 ATP-dependent DNA ligase [Thermopolyspora flexuosa]